jgi:hypothetical protein
MEIEIGGNLIDRQYGLWLTIWGNLTTVNYISPSPPVDTFLKQGCTGVEPSVSTLSDRTGYNHQQQNTLFDFNLVTSNTYGSVWPTPPKTPANITLKYYINANTSIPTTGGPFNISIKNINNLPIFTNIDPIYKYFFLYFLEPTGGVRQYICSYTSVSTSSGVTTFTGCNKVVNDSTVNYITTLSSNYISPAFKITGQTYDPSNTKNKINAFNKEFYLQFYTYYTGFSSKCGYTIYIGGNTSTATSYGCTCTQNFLDFQNPSPNIVYTYCYNGYQHGRTQETNLLNVRPTSDITLTTSDFVVFTDLPTISSQINVLPTSGPTTLLLNAPINLNFYETVLPSDGVLITTYNGITYYLVYTGLSYQYIYATSYFNTISYIFNITSIYSYPSTSVTIPVGTIMYFSYYNYNLSNAPTEAYVPMQFWFCKNPGLALPLIALQYSEVKLNIQLADYKELHATQFSDVNLNSIRIFADFVYLDTNERRLFAQNAHEYLIEQLQRNIFNNSFASNVSGGQLQIKMNFSNPVKEIVFCGSPDATGINSGGIATPTNLLTNKSVSLTNVQMAMVFNQVNRFTSRNLKYFTRNQIWDVHSGSGSANSSNDYDINDNIGVYSFSLRPEEFQPSGSCNFSRITNPYLVFSNFDTGEELNYLDIYATNYNVLRIMSGMGNLAFAY